jgi:hypothetical protein
MKNFLSSKSVYTKSSIIFSILFTIIIFLAFTVEFSNTQIDLQEYRNYSITFFSISIYILLIILGIFSLSGLLIGYSSKKYGLFSIHLVMLVGVILMAATLTSESIGYFTTNEKISIEEEQKIITPEEINIPEFETPKILSGRIDKMVENNGIYFINFRPISFIECDDYELCPNGYRLEESEEIIEDLAFDMVGQVKIFSKIDAPCSYVGINTDEDSQFVFQTITVTELYNYISCFDGDQNYLSRFEITIVDGLIIEAIETFLP